MTIILYRNVSENYRLDKVLTDAIEYNGTLKNSSSVINPTFTIASSANLSTYNYCYIPEFNRYYYINSIEVLTSELWSFGCHVDVLKTYASQIRNLNAIISRQENEYNLYLNDDKLIVECDRDFTVMTFNNPLTPASSGGASIVLTVAGGEFSSS